MTQERLRELLSAAGCDQRKLAAGIGYSEASISRYLGGSRPMTEEFKLLAERYLLRMAHAKLREISEAVSNPGGNP